MQTTVTAASTANFAWALIDTLSSSLYDGALRCSYSAQSLRVASCCTSSVRSCGWPFCAAAANRTGKMILYGENTGKATSVVSHL